MEEDPDLCGRTLGEFHLIKPIGKGGHGTVYRAEQQQLRRTAVVKVLHQRFQHNDVARERFKREAKLASQLDHPYVAHVYAFGVEPQDGLAWIAMELLEGMTLRRWLEVHRRMPLEQFVPLFERIARVVQDAHDHGIVHRDLKPSNLMVLEVEGQLIPKLLDFGIAKEPHRSDATVTASAATMGAQVEQSRTELGSDASTESIRLTRSNAVMGSPAYTAPEQFSNPRAVDGRADIYSLGIVAYEALTGSLPFIAKTLDEYCVRHRYDDVPSLFSRDLDRIFQRALAKEPRARYSTVLELASELGIALRASERQQIRSAAQEWEIRNRTPGLLWGDDVLADPSDWTCTSSSELSESECAFLEDSRRHARWARWLRRWFVALSIILVIGGLGWFQHDTAMQTRADARLAQEQARAAQKLTEATITHTELEQGRSALLHGEPNAQLHLSRAYHRGDHSPSTEFMYAISLQPKLAELARFASSFGRMWSAAFSPDSRQIVTTDDRGAQVHDAQTYGLLFALHHGSEVYQAVYSTDSTRLVTAAQDAVRIWDATSGMLVHKLARKRNDGAPSDYFAVALSADGQLVAASDAAGSVTHVWDAITGAPIAELRNDPMEFPRLAFSADSHWLAATGGKDVRVFDTHTWTLARTIPAPRIQNLAFDPTSARLVTGTATGDVAIWAIPRGERIRHLREVGDPVGAVAFSPDGQLVVAGSRDGAAQVWQARSGELQSQFNLRHSKILAVEFDQTSKLVLAAGADGTVVVADAMLGMPVTVLEGPQKVVFVAHFDPSSRRVVGASLDGTAWVWDATSPYRRWSSPPMSDNCGIVTNAEPDRRFIAVGCRDYATRVWDTSRDQLLAELPSVSPVGGDFTSAFPAVSSTGDRGAIARGNTVEVYELPSKRLLRTIAHGAAVNTVAFASAGRDIVSGAVDGSLLVTRDNGSPYALPNYSGGIDAVEFLPDGRVVAADAQRRLRFYAPGGEVLADLEIPMRVMSLRIEGTRLVTVPIVPFTVDVAPPLLVDIERYRVIARLEGHIGRVFSARWVAGNQILTAGGDGTVRLWDGSTGQLRQVFQGGRGGLADATLAPDGLVIAGGADGLLRFWDAASERLLWTLRAHTSQIIGVHVEGRDIVTRGFAGELSRWTLPDAKQVIEACDDQERCAIIPR